MDAVAVHPWPVTSQLYHLTRRHTPLHYVTRTHIHGQGPLSERQSEFPISDLVRLHRRLHQHIAYGAPFCVEYGVLSLAEMSYPLSSDCIRTPGTILKSNDHF